MAYLFYARVSTVEQNEARQIEISKNCGYEIAETYVDKCSGKNADRPALKEMLGYMRKGDTVIVSDFSRLARSTRDMLTLVEVFKEKGVEFISLKEKVDTSTPQGRFMLTVFSALAELERETILERQREGIAIAKAEGKYQGRKPIGYDEKKLRAECKKWHNGEQTATQTMQNMGMKSGRFYRIVKELGLNKPIENNPIAQSWFKALEEQKKQTENETE
ncbi:MAG: recombinase family protein [Ruminococcus sp.]|nr:recombinase family protein [Ruminococcus sp.]